MRQSPVILLHATHPPATKAHQHTPSQPYPTRPSHQQPGIGTQWNFKVEDCRKAYAELKARGVKFKSQPVEYAWAIGAEFTDPDGNHFSIVQPLPMSPSSWKKGQ